MSGIERERLKNNERDKEQKKTEGSNDRAARQ